MNPPATTKTPLFRGRFRVVMLFSAVVAGLSLLALTLLPALALTWSTEIIDGPDQVGPYSSLALDPATGYPRVSYNDSTHGSLKYAWWDGSMWISETVDAGPNNVGWHTSLALDPDTGYPRISYMDVTLINLKYAWWNGAMWISETVDASGLVGQYTSLALDPDSGYPRISYNDLANSDVKYAFWDGSTWISETVDGPDAVGLYTSLALDPVTGDPRISYHDVTHGSLKYAYWDGGAWISETVDAGPNIVGRDTSLALDPTSGDPRISYLDYTSDDLKYAFWDGSAWISETVDSQDLVGNFTSLALDPTTGNPGISYLDGSQGALKYARWDGSMWISETVDTGGVGTYTSLALDACGNPRISYADSGGAHDVKYAAAGECAMLTIVKTTTTGSGSGFQFNASTGLSRTLNAGHSFVTGITETGEIVVTETLPTDWLLQSIQCDSQYNVPATGVVSVPVLIGENITCTFTNEPIVQNACPAEPLNGTVGNQLTTIMGEGMGDLTSHQKVRKLVVPNAGDLNDLYGQMAYKNFGMVRFVRFIYPDKSYEQVKPETDLADSGAVSWYGTDLDESKLVPTNFIKGRWFIRANQAKKNLPRAMVLYMTHQTGSPYANAWSTFGWPDNFVAHAAPFNQQNTNALAIPELQATADVTVQLAIADINDDARSIDLTVEAGGVQDMQTIALPTDKNLLNLVEVVLPNVPAGTNEVEITMESAREVGDSAALLGAAAHFACAIAPQ